MRFQSAILRLGRSIALALWLPALFLSADPAASQTTASVKAAYASKYVWRGYDLWNGNPAFQPDLSVSLDRLGIYAGIWSSYSIKDGCSDPFGDPCQSWDEHDFYLGGSGSAAEGGILETAWDIGYTYYQFFRRHGSDSNEIALNMIQQGIGNLANGMAPTPYWGLYYGWPASSGGKESRWAKLGLKQSAGPDWAPAAIFVETMWDDGAGAFALKSGWSHVKAGIWAEPSIGGVKIKPAAYYQKALSGKGAPAELLADEFWFEISVSASF